MVTRRKETSSYPITNSFCFNHLGLHKRPRYMLGSSPSWNTYSSGSDSHIFLWFTWAQVHNLSKCQYHHLHQSRELFLPFLIIGKWCVIKKMIETKRTGTFGQTIWYESKVGSSKTSRSHTSINCAKSRNGGHLLSTYSVWSSTLATSDSSCLMWVAILRMGISGPVEKSEVPHKITQFSWAELYSTKILWLAWEHAKGENGPGLVNSAKLQERNQHFPSPALGRGQYILFGDMGLGKLSLVTNATGCQSPAGLD